MSSVNDTKTNNGQNSEDENPGKVKVVCRFRPMNSFESVHGGSMDISIRGENSVDIKQTSNANDSKYQFSYDRVFGIKSSQKELYEMAAKPVVESVMQGFNGTIMAYGQTASGKTYTMQGQNRSDSALRGIIPRMVETVFDFISDSPEHIEFMVKISIIEIYMEELRDLLSIKERKKMKIRSCGTRGIFVENLTEVYVSSPQEVYKYIKIGNKNRSVGRTNMNIVSSRSHLMVSLTLHQNDTIENIAKTGKLLLVDLAGSEKVSKSGSDGRTFEEAKKINKSLLSLGQVIYSLNEGSHVPYRDSKLTRLLEQSLGGNSKTTLIICCSPANYNESETLSTLRFGTRAQMVQNRPVLNREYTIEQLKTLLEKSQKDKQNLRDRVALLEEYIREKMPQGSYNDLEIYEKNRSKLVKNSSRLTKASTNYTIGMESPTKKFGKQVIIADTDTSDIEQLKQEVLQFKQKAQSLRFENEQLQKLLTESKEVSCANSSVHINSNLSQRSIEVASPQKSKKSNAYSAFFSPQRAEGMFKQMFDIEYGDKLIEEFDNRVTALNLRADISDDLREIVMKQEEKNLMLHSKLMDMRGLIEQMMKQFRDLVNRDYYELQKIHKEMVLKTLRDKDKEKKSAMSRVDVLNLLSVYHSENNVLKRKLNLAKDSLSKKEDIIQDERKKHSTVVMDHEAKMGRLEKLLSTFLKKTKEPQVLFEKLKANSHYELRSPPQLTQSQVPASQTPTNPRVDWSKMNQSADRSKISHTKKRRYDLLNAYESYNRTAKIIKKLKGGEPIYQKNEKA